MSRLSLRAAINAMCKGCLYDPGNGNGAWREQVQACTSSNCALHAVRPLPVKATKRAEDALIGLLAPSTANEHADALNTARIGHNDPMPNVGRAA
jgi:hypothetical protein